MKSVLSCVLLWLLVPVVASAGSVEEIEKGDTGVVVGNYSVYVWNPDPIRNKDQIFRYGDSCTLEAGNYVSVIDFDGDWVLVRYSVAVQPNLHRCPSGVVSYISEKVFLEMKEAREEKEKVRKLLKEERIDK